MPDVVFTMLPDDLKGVPSNRPDGAVQPGNDPDRPTGREPGDGYVIGATIIGIVLGGTMGFFIALGVAGIFISVISTVGGAMVGGALGGFVGIRLKQLAAKRPDGLSRDV